jgi:hypothetical protein
MIEVLEKWKDQSLGKLVPALSADPGDNPGPEDSGGAEFFHRG